MTRSALRFLLVAFLAASFGIPAYAQTGTQSAFTKNLTLGSSDPQVTLLQQFLNMYPDTRIADTGAGAPGNETAYFGPLTRDAVIRFQEKYAADVLAPSGLLEGTGYVGPATRGKLNELLTSAPAQEASTTTAQAAPAAASSTGSASMPGTSLMITSISGTEFHPGDTLTITGTGFTAPFSLFVGDTEYKDPPVDSTGAVSVKVPAQDAALMVWVKTAASDTRALQPLFIVVTEKTDMTDRSDLINYAKAQNERLLSPVSPAL